MACKCVCWLPRPLLVLCTALQLVLASWDHSSASAQPFACAAVFSHFVVGLPTALLLCFKAHLGVRASLTGLCLFCVLSRMLARLGSQQLPNRTITAMCLLNIATELYFTMHAMW